MLERINQEPTFLTITRDKRDMNDNTKKSSPLLMDAILKAKTDTEKQSVCSLVLSALEDRDNQINKSEIQYKELEEKYRIIVNLHREMTRVIHSINP